MIEFLVLTLCLFLTFKLVYNREKKMWIRSNYYFPVKNFASHCTYRKVIHAHYHILHGPTWPGPFLYLWYIVPLSLSPGPTLIIKNNLSYITAPEHLHLPFFLPEILSSKSWHGCMAKSFSFFRFSAQIFLDTSDHRQWIYLLQI